jgi:predicted dehydrogenase
MKIIAAVIGTGIGEKHIEAINNFEKSKVKMVCEKNKKKFPYLKKKFPKIRFTTNEDDIFDDKEINLVSIASYDNDHFYQLIRCINSNKKKNNSRKTFVHEFLSVKKNC